MGDDIVANVSMIELIVTNLRPSMAMHLIVRYPDKGPAIERNF